MHELNPAGAPLDELKEQEESRAAADRKRSNLKVFGAASPSKEQLEEQEILKHLDEENSKNIENQGSNRKPEKISGANIDPVDIDLANMDLNINIQQEQLSKPPQESILNKIIVEDVEIRQEEMSKAKPQIRRLRDIEIDLFVLFS